MRGAPAPPRACSSWFIRCSCRWSPTCPPAATWSGSPRAHGPSRSSWRGARSGGPWPSARPSPSPWPPPPPRQRRSCWSRWASGSSSSPPGGTVRSRRASGPASRSPSVTRRRWPSRPWFAAPCAPGAGAEDAPAHAGFDPAQVLSPEPEGAAHAFALAAEKTGVVVLPVNTSGIGTLGYVLAVVALLAALHPGFVAARAPRACGAASSAAGPSPSRCCSSSGSASACSGEPRGRTRDPRAGGRDGRRARDLGDGPLRRPPLDPARAHGRPLRGADRGSGTTVQWAAAEVGVVHEAVLAAGREDDWSRVTWILDPPRRIAGVEALAPEHDSSLTSPPFLPPGVPPLAVKGVPSGAFWLLTGEPEFQERAAPRADAADATRPDRRRAGGGSACRDAAGAPRRAAVRAARP